MQNENVSKAGVYFGWFVKRMALVLYDVFVVNMSYYLALVIRFYVNNEFRTIAAEQYLPAFITYAPFYTVISLIIFAAMKLYTNHWKQAGLQDFNRLFVANALTSVVQIGGTLLFVCRMPLSYYFIGAVLQLMLIAASRFGYRLIVMESARIRFLSRANMNVMIVGVGETARVLRNQLENDGTNVARPVCIFSYNGVMAGKIANGLPVLSDVKKMADHLRRYQVECVILADPVMPAEIRSQIREQCQKDNVEVQDFSGYLRADGSEMVLRTVLEHISGPVTVVADGKNIACENGADALMRLSGNYSVKKISAENDRVMVELTSATTILNDVHQDWVKDTERETGNEISFF